MVIIKGENMAIDRKRINQLKSHVRAVSPKEAKKDYGMGNIDLNSRPTVKNGDDVSTVRSMSFYDDKEKKEILVPTVVNGRIVSDDEARKHYYETGEHLGKFNTVKSANDYAQKLHEQEEARINGYKKKRGIQPVETPENMVATDGSEFADSFMEKVRIKANNFMERAKINALADQMYEKLPYWSYEAGRGATNVIGGMEKGALLDATAKAQEGAEKAKAGETEDTKNPTETLSRMGLSTLKDLSISNPALHSTLSTIDTIVNSKERSKDAKKENEKVKKIWDQKDKGAVAKIIETIQSEALDVRDKAPFIKAYNELFEYIGQKNPEASKVLENTLLESGKKYDEMNQRVNEEAQLQSDFSRFVGGAISDSTGSLTSGVIGTATGTGLLPLYAQVYGNEAYDLWKQGNDMETAREVANRRALTEYVTEKATTGLKIFKDVESTGLDNLTDGLIKKGAKKISGKTAKRAFIIISNTIANGLKESGEEVLGDLINLAFDKATIDPDAEYTLDDLKNTILRTMLSTTVSNAVTESVTGEFSHRELYNDSLKESLTDIFDKSDLSDEQKDTLKSMLDEVITDENFESNKEYAEEALRSTQQYNAEEAVYQPAKAEKVKETTERIINGETTLEEVINESERLSDKEKSKLIREAGRKRDVADTLSEMYDLEDISGIPESQTTETEEELAELPEVENNETDSEGKPLLEAEQETDEKAEETKAETKPKAKKTKTTAKVKTNTKAKAKTAVKTNVQTTTESNTQGQELLKAEKTNKVSQKTQTKTNSRSKVGNAIAKKAFDEHDFTYGDTEQAKFTEYVYNNNISADEVNNMTDQDIAKIVGREEEFNKNIQKKKSLEVKQKKTTKNVKEQKKQGTKTKNEQLLEQSKETILPKAKTAQIDVSQLIEDSLSKSSLNDSDKAEIRKYFTDNPNEATEDAIKDTIKGYESYQSNEEETETDTKQENKKEVSKTETKNKAKTETKAKTKKAEAKLPEAKKETSKQELPTQADILDTTKTYNTGRNKIYAKYMDKKTEYDRSALDEGMNLIKGDKRWGREKADWLNIADYIGTKIADKTDQEIEEIAFRTWQDVRPSQKGNMNRHGKKFVSFNSDEWINTIYNRVKQIRNENNETLKVNEAEFEQLSIEGFNNPPQTDLITNEWEKYEKTKQKAEKVLKDSGHKIVFEKRRLARDFIRSGYIDLNGTIVKNAVDVADVAQIFRNPCYETFRILYTKGDTIVGQEAISAQVPGQASVFTTEDARNRGAKGFYKIKSRMERLGADGYYLIHNHPSGVANASRLDLQTTENINRKIDGFKGHVIVNSGTYALITVDEQGVASSQDSIKIENYSPDKIDKMQSKDPYYEQKITNSTQLAQIAFGLKNNPNYSSLIFTDARGRVSAVIDVPNSFLNSDFYDIENFIRNRARENGGTRAFFATQDLQSYDRASALTVLTDGVLFGTNSTGAFYAKSVMTGDGLGGNDLFRTNYVDKHTHRVGEEEERYQVDKSKQTWYNSIKRSDSYGGEETISTDNRGSGRIQDRKIEEIMNSQNESSFSLSDNLSSIAEKLNDKDVAQILTSPVKKVKPELRFASFLKREVIDKGAVFADLDFKNKDVKNRTLQSSYNNLINSDAQATYALAFGHHDSKSLTEIKNSIPEEELGDFYNYAYHLLNIDRMSLEENAKKQADEVEKRIHALEKQIKASVESTEKEALKADLKELKKEHKKLLKVKNKPVFSKNITAEDSRKVVSELERRHNGFKSAIEDVYKFLDGNMKLMVEKGVVSQETADYFKATYPHYVPINRVHDNGLAISVPLDTNKTGINNPIRRAKGGNENIQPLFETIANRTRQTYTAVNRNQLGNELYDVLNNIGGLQSEYDSLDELNELIEKEGTFGTFEDVLSKEGKNTPTFTVFKNGEKITFGINSDIYNALKGQHDMYRQLNSSKFLKGVQKVSEIRRSLITEWNPLFLFTNAVKDAQDVLLNSQHPLQTYSKFTEAYAQITKNGEWFKEYLQNGGYNETLFEDGEFKGFEDNDKNGGLMMPLGAISNANRVIELIPRVAEYIASREAGSSIETAMLDSARVTTNFKAGGETAKFLNRNGFTFLNANIQGLVQQARNIREANAKGLQGWTNLAIRTAIAGLPAILFNSIMWRDDDDFEKISDYVKDNYYIVCKIPESLRGLFGGNDFLRVPKGRALSVIQKILTNIGDYMTNDKKIDIESVTNDFWEDIKFAWNAIGVADPGKNNTFAPLMQVATNESWYGQDIVPSRLQNEDIENQFDASTDKFSVGVGKLIGKSELASSIAKRANINPMTIHYLLDQYSGVIGDFALPLLTPQAESNPLANKFSTSSTMNSKYPSEYYETLDQLKANSTKTNATDEDKLLYKYFSSDNKDMAEMYKEKRDTQLLDIDDDVKRESIFNQQAEINDLAERKLSELETLKINGNTATIGDKTYIKDSEGEWSELKESLPAGLSTGLYVDYKNILSEAKSEYEDRTGKSLPEKEQNLLLEEQNYTDNEKQLLYSVTTGKDDGTYHALEAMNGSVSSSYLEYIKKSQAGYFTNKSDTGGKDVTGQKQDRLLQFLEESDLTNIEMYYIYADAGYACSKNGKGLKKSQRDALRRALEESRLDIDQDEYERMIKKLDEADANAKKWGVD